MTIRIGAAEPPLPRVGLLGDCLSDLFLPFVEPTGLKELGTEKIPPIVTRGVLLDMAALRGVETVPEGTVYNRAEIEAAVKKQGTPIRKGDVVLFHSGRHAKLATNRGQWWQMHPGPGVEGALYLAADGVHEFLFVLSQPKFKGAVQMVINPIAIH